MLTDILINVSADNDADPAVNCGLALARTLGSHVTGAVFGIEPIVPVSYFGAIPGEIMMDLRNAAEQSARDGAARFMRAAEAVGVEAEARPVVSSVDGALAAFAHLTRLHDLTILGQPNPDRPGGELEFLEAALFDSGRAVLVVPYIQKKPIELSRVLIAWDGGRAATRAIAEARPLLMRAKKVEVLVVETGKPDPNALPGADLAKHLVRHKLKVELRRILAPSASEIDETILNAVSDDGIDLVVMGGYGHSRLREFMLGGVTRSIIESMTAPVLLAH